MKKIFHVEQIDALSQAAKWLVVASAVGALAGAASAVFLLSLDWATRFRESHLWLIALLPIAGFVVGWIYHRHGAAVESGNDLLIDEIHDPKSVTAVRMAPLILFATIVTHLFGGSAGREGTAVQMGGSLADRLTGPLRFGPEDRRILLMTGVSAGFASVFGTPLAGAVFGLEVLSIGWLRYDAIFPCFVGAIVGNGVTHALGIPNDSYAIPLIPTISAGTLLSAAAAGVLFGIVGRLFAEAIHRVGDFFKKTFSYAPLRPAVGGAVVALAVWALHTTKYIGLGIPTINQSFTGRVEPWDFAGKFAFTALTLGSGFKGGEVTPMFFIGAALGNTLAWILPLSPAVLAGIGFVAVFAGAANTPLASTLLAMELFGAPIGVLAGIGCVTSYLFSGHTGVYHAQRIGTHKHRREKTPDGAV